MVNIEYQQRLSKVMKFTKEDKKRYIPKPYMDFFLALRYTADDDEIKTPAGVNADYRGYG